MTRRERELINVLRGLYTHCTMIHKHWGENSNQKDATLAIRAGEQALANAEKENQP